MGKLNIILTAALIALCAAGTEAHEKKKVSVPGQAIAAKHDGATHIAMTTGEGSGNTIAQSMENSEDGMTLILLFGALTAISLTVTACFSFFRLPSGWMKWHKMSAYITLVLMLVHGSLALYGHFFG